ncbi:hypothetical protein IH992_17895, partial [Candidatus Poribacteria bacterium]|nr:hypothetical protein [Candidatus Poribacteria bacterium]
MRRFAFANLYVAVLLLLFGCSKAGEKAVLGQDLEENQAKGNVDIAVDSDGNSGEMPKITEIVPVFGIGSYDEAVAHYVDWLGFNLDWEWREAPGRPVIMAISRDGVSLMLNEHPASSSASSLVLKVTDIYAFAEEWNAKRPNSVTVDIEPPYDIPSISLRDPFGNSMDFQ